MLYHNLIGLKSIFYTQINQNFRYRYITTKFYLSTLLTTYLSLYI